MGLLVYLNFQFIEIKMIVHIRTLHVWRILCPYSEKSVRIRSFSGPYFPAFGSLLIQSKCRKIRTRKTPNRDTFHAVDLVCN